ncbi:Fructose-bisphosphate aldolase [Mycoplasmopsis maculosa]|uniref:Fructose-bisphosphate aldolase n=1 Tax=Mycoplasmopsis maculosa TaxID=114885 RepID=A0A449B567_9BACT|nr:class II fructose-1,6-bisphosphate aldolase [Mycoplasmopsis maculosa]VEU75715.1 Fructose-bisphosphate aldolase [Mycoplasmopsis maculosa]
MSILNAKVLVEHAVKNNYAVPHINVNNLEWVKATLLTAEEAKSPLIISASTSAIKYMGGYKTVCNLIKNMYDEYKMTIPLAIHLDHGNFEACLLAIESGFTSIMFDGSSLDFSENYSKTATLVKLAHDSNISIEAEVGSIGGVEDDIISCGELASLEEAIQLSNLGIDFLAAGIGNIHGPYPKNWTSLDFNRLKEIREKTNLGIVLHGGSGIPEDQIKKAISLGIAKINVNTELQQHFARAVEEFVLSGKSKEKKNYDPRIFLKPGYEAVCKLLKSIFILFGSLNKANDFF